MKQFLSKVVLFLIPIFIYILFFTQLLPFLLKYTEGPNTKQQLEVSFNNVLHRDFDLLILGNSRLYRGVNPDKLTILSYNFSHDNDNYNQIFYKLKFLEKNNIKYNYLILGIDYFEFSFKSDTRNYIYGKLLGEDYLKDYDSKFSSLKISQYKNLMNPKTLGHLIPKKSIPFIKENGQYIKDGIASKNDKVKRDVSRLPFQINYFNKIINHCNEKNIKLFLIMLPTRKNELSSYNSNQIKEFNDFIHKHLSIKNNIFWNFSLDATYSMTDYTDITHFNSKTADRFSLQLNDSINKYIQSIK